MLVLANPRTWNSSIKFSVPLAGRNISGLSTQTTPATSGSPRLPKLQEREKKGKFHHTERQGLRPPITANRFDYFSYETEKQKGRDSTTRSVRSTNYTRRQIKPTLSWSEWVNGDAKNNILNLAPSFSLVHWTKPLVTRSRPAEL